jgi:glycosyltransferase involved in cell wall biosynthesis
MDNRRAEIVAVFHSAQWSGPARTLAPRLLALERELGRLEVAFPSAGPAMSLFPAGRTRIASYRPLTRDFAYPAHAAIEAIRLARLLRGRKLAVIATAYLPAALLAARAVGVPTLVYAAEILRDEGRAGTMLARLTGSLATRIVAASELVAQQFPSVRTSIVHPGIARLPEGVPLHREPGRRVVAAVGALTHGRGQDVFLRAIAAARARDPSVLGLVVGDPHPRRVDLEYRERLRDLATELSLGDGVRFVGATATVQDVYASADVVVNAARFAEPFGRVVHEALLAGRPVVATRVGSLPELLEHERTALLVESEDPASLAEAILRLLDDHDLAARIVAAGAAAVSARFDEERGIAAFREAAWAAIGSQRP